MDDDDQHIRRNLVVFSSGILLAAWLRLPGLGVLDKLFPITPDVPAARLWAVGFAVLLYLGWRFKHSPQGSEMKKNVLEEIHSQEAGLFYQSLERALKQLSNGTLSQILCSITNFPAIWPRNDPENIEFFGLQSALAKTATIRLRYPGKTDSEMLQDQMIPIEWSGWLLHWIQLRAFFRAHFNSKVAVDSLAPVVLALAAEFVLFCKIGASVIAVS